MNSASFKSPITWLRETLAPSQREKNTQAELEAARKAEVEKGQGSVFDVVAETVKKDVEPEAEMMVVATKAKKKADQVRGRLDQTLEPVQRSICSINIPRQTSRSRTGN